MSFLRQLSALIPYLFTWGLLCHLGLLGKLKYWVGQKVHLGFSIASYRRRKWQPTPVFLPGKSHGWRSLVGYSPWGRKESDTTEWLHFHFSLSCIGEGNGNPLQSSCLENPRGGGAWWAAISGVAQSRIRLKRLSSSSSIPSYGKTWMNFLANLVDDKYKVITTMPNILSIQ